MAEEFQYQKERQKFGRHGVFEDTDIQIVGSVIHNEKQEEMYVLRNPNKVVLDNIPVLSEHRVSQPFRKFELKLIGLNFPLQYR